MRMVSLFSGAGGMDLGFARAGFTPVFANDTDKWAVATYNRISEVRDRSWADTAARFAGHTATPGDIAALVPSLTTGMADVVVGGPPCQGFSVAGRMDPADPRSQLVFTFLDAVARIRPTAFVMENVAALASNGRWTDVLTRLHDTAAADYTTTLVVVNAAEFGVPQTRKRMFLIGLPPHAPAFTMPNSRHVNPVTVRDVLTTLPPAGTPGNDDMCAARITPARHPNVRRSPYAGHLLNGQGRIINLDAPAPTLPASMGGNRTPVIDTAVLANKHTPPWVETYHANLIAGGPPIEDIPAGRLRRLTVGEAAALQTFPTDMPWCGPQSARYRQIGNAVPPVLAWHLASALHTTLTS